MVKLYFNDNLPLVNLNWAIFRGQSDVKEDFSRATLWVWLISKNNRIPLQATAEDGIIKSIIPTTLASGIYSLKAIWVKRGTYNFNDQAIFNGKQLGLETRVVSEIKNAFEVVDRLGELEFTSDAYDLKFKSSAATYGYDGLDAYEIAILRGKTILPEDEWLSINSGKAVNLFQQVKQSLEAEAARITAQQGVTQEQGQNLSNVSELANETASKALVMETKTKAVENAQAQNDEHLAKIRQTVTLLDKAIVDLQNKTNPTMVDKGIYLSEATLNTKYPDPVEGDCASVARPYYIQGGEFNPQEFFGDSFIGDKAENLDNWHNNIDSIQNKYYTSNGILYKIIKPTTLQYIADVDHNPDNELVEEGIIFEVEPIEVPINGRIPFDLYLAEDGKWVNTHTTREFTVNSIVSALDVFDGDQNQQTINDVNKTNALIHNFNIIDLQNIINALRNNFMALCEKVCVTGDIELQPIPQLTLGSFIADGNGDNTRLDVCRLPIILS